MLLLTGPAGSGKTFRILERFRDALRRRDAGVRLLTPIATMAQRLQNQVAREGCVFRPSLIQTLSRFVDPFTADLPQVTEPLLYLIVEEAAGRVNRPEFAHVVRLPGFCAALARTVEELSSAGCDALRLADSMRRHGFQAPLGEAFLAVYGAVEEEFRSRGLGTRAQRLMRAAERIAREGLPAIHTVWLDGFYALPDPELAVIRAMCRYADVTITLPAAPITEATRARLLEVGFVEEVCARETAPPRIELCATPSLEREADEIARRILEQSAAARPFRDMGVIVRSPEVYEPILRTTFDRFGIPARFYFDSDLEKHAVVRCLTGMVDAMLGGWGHAETLAAIRLAPGMASDEFDFAVREQMPGAGLEKLGSLANAPIGLLESFDRLETWRTLSLAPVEWAARLQDLRELLALGQPEPGSFETAAIARGQAAALELFSSAIDEAASALSQLPVKLSEFWPKAKSVLRLTPLRVADGRRDVVHVLGAHEARQWRLPVVFVCGLVEKQFPKFHTPDPFFPEAARAQLKHAGIRLRTAADFEVEERFLFDWAMTRATESLTLSYPQSDARGQQNLPSLFLDGVAAKPVPWKPVRPRQGRKPEAARPASVISSADLLDALVARHATFRPTALESYLQCPFQFFGRYSLQLQPAPKRPEQRLDFLTQGIIVHEVLAALSGNSRRLEEIFDDVFARICERQRVPSSYRTAAGRERMLADLRALLTHPDWPSVYEIRTEQKFQYNLSADVEIKGRIDRLEVTPDGRGWVTDYKYSGAQNTKDRATDENLLQPQLYLLALERFFALHPEGMRFLGFKGGIQATQWVPFEPTQAVDMTLRIAAEIRAGRVEPAPADQEKCRFCELRDTCRFQAAAESTVAEGASSWD
ncbi:MAG TPA: PD-(D/E)XK nuclease family protein [Bryobacteraceae bacterium]|jgi:ATP-dependent helicase/DNAse subunit B|nr:PD-(D/E)XK nuclease family protein [Bryobacteraceae bacterium]